MCFASLRLPFIYRFPFIQSEVPKRTRLLHRLRVVRTAKVKQRIARPKEKQQQKIRHTKIEYKRFLGNGLGRVQPNSIK